MFPLLRWLFGLSSGDGTQQMSAAGSVNVSSNHIGSGQSARVSTYTMGTGSLQISPSPKASCTSSAHWPCGAALLLGTQVTIIFWAHPFSTLGLALQCLQVKLVP